MFAGTRGGYLCADLGVKGELRHACYIRRLRKVLKNYKRAIVTAASRGSLECLAAQVKTTTVQMPPNAS